MRFYSTLIASLLLLWGATNLSAQELSIDGTTVSDENAQDILAGKGEGKAGCVCYNRATNTLYLHGASLDKGIEVLGFDKELTIKILGECTFTADPFGLHTDSFVTFTSEDDGKLIVKAKSGASGGFAMEGEQAIVRFKDCDVAVKKSGDSFAVASLLRGYGLLVFDHSKWISDGGLVGAMNRIHIKRSDLKLPLGGTVAYKQPDPSEPPFANIIDGDKRPNYGTFKLEPNNKYPICIDDVDITEDNAENVFPNSAIPDGYVRYNPATNRLIISNLDYFTMGTASIQNLHDETDLPLTIEVRGYNTIWSGYNSCIYSRGPLVITGDGNLHVNTEDVKLGSAGIFIADNQTLTLEKTRVYTTGFYALAGAKGNSAKLRIKDAYLEMNCTRPVDGACMEGFQSMDLENVSIIEPQGAYFDASYSGILLTNDTPARGRVVIGNKQWQAIEEPNAQEVRDWQPILECRGNLLTIDLKGQPNGALARLFDLKGACIAQLKPQSSSSLQLPSGSYVFVVEGYKQKILVP